MRQIRRLTPRLHDAQPGFLSLRKREPRLSVERVEICIFDVVVDVLIDRRRDEGQPGVLVAIVFHSLPPPSAAPSLAPRSRSRLASTSQWPYWLNVNAMELCPSSAVIVASPSCISNSRTDAK